MPGTVSRQISLARATTKVEHERSEGLVERKTRCMPHFRDAVIVAPTRHVLALLHAHPYAYCGHAEARQRMRVCVCVRACVHVCVCVCMSHRCDPRSSPHLCQHGHQHLQHGHFPRQLPQRCRERLGLGGTERAGQACCRRCCCR